MSEKKRKPEEVLPSVRVSKRIKRSFESMVESVRQSEEENLRRPNAQRVEEGSVTIQNVFESWVNNAKTDVRIETNGQNIRGNEKPSLRDVKNNTDYVKVMSDDAQGINFLIRKSSDIFAQHLYVRECQYEVEVRTSSELSNITIPGFIGAIWDVFDKIFTECLNIPGYDEICFHATHRELEGSLSSSIFSLTEENRDRIIYEIMDRITGWNQSASPNAAVKHLSISVTLLKRNMPGNGVLLAIGDDNLRKKAFSRYNFNGSIFYVDCEENCFFVSIYFGLAYNRYARLFSSAKSMSEKKRLHTEALKIFESKGKQLEDEAKSFFWKSYSIDVENYESGSTCFLKKVSKKAQCQISIFSDSESYRRVQMIPDTYEPLLEHVDILLTQYLKKTEPRKTVRNEDNFSKFHYHGIKHTSLGFTGQQVSFCVFCGIYHAYGNYRHTCKNSDLLCEMCQRALAEKEIFEKMTSSVQTNFCFKVPEGLLKDSQVTCTICRKKANSKLCYEIHKRQKCRNRVRCQNCTRVIQLIGKYSPTQRTEPVLIHDSCEEVLCTTCNDYVEGFEDIKNPTHTCYVSVIKKAKQWPSLIVCFDFETFPCDSDGTMEVNLVHLIYQAESNNPSSDFKGIFFSDVPLRDVILNNQTVHPGEEYTPDLSEELKDYYPLEMLKREVSKAKRPKNKKKIPVKGEEEIYDDSISHLLRNPEIYDLSELGFVKPHIDILNMQLNEEIPDPVNESDIESEIENEIDTESFAQKKRKKHIDWREELTKLKNLDKILVDKMNHAKERVTEEEAEFEDKIFKEKMRAKEKRRIKDCKFIVREASEVTKDDTSEEENGIELEESVHSDNNKKVDEIQFFKNCAFEANTESGFAPGNYEKRNAEDQLDFHIDYMKDSLNVKKMLTECMNSETCTENITVEGLKLFCKHETDVALKKRFEIYKKLAGQKKSNALKQFALYILQPKFKDAVFLGMYSSGFDNHFVFMQLIELGIRVNPVYKGNKLITFSIPALNIRFLDFFCYVPSSLKNLEKSFDLKTGGKGFFPHLLNLPENYGLELPHLPPIAYYEPEMMKEKDLKEFQNWYAENYDRPFKFGQEILTYCEMDVKILMAACLSFVRETLIQQSEFVERVRVLEPNGRHFFVKTESGEHAIVEPNLVHVFSTGLCTLSSYVNTLFRSFYLEEKTLPIVSHDVEESYSTKSSKLEIEVLTFLREAEKFTDLQFGDSFRGQRRFTIVCPETKKVHTFFVDGYSPTTKTVIEILGCVFHGCYDCFTAENKMKNGLQNFEAIRLTQKRIELLKLHPDVDEVRVIKECEWKKRKEKDSRVIEFLQKNKSESLGSRRMSLKETFRGGLVEPMCVAYDAEKVAKMVEKKFGQPLLDPYGKLVDINSMYPAQLMPAFSYSTREVDYTMCPVYGHVTLRGAFECLKECNENCNIECPRIDPHFCNEKETCYLTCNVHHPPSEWGKLPGFALVKILPPDNQRFPILRMRLSKTEGSKNFSTLCRTCAIEGNAFEGLKACMHDNEKRSLFGEFTTAELNFAIRHQGYKLLEVYEIQFYPRYSLTMFQNLLKSFYMMKVASKGFPENCGDDLQKKEEYLDTLKSVCSFKDELNLQHISNNPARVTVSKLSSNALVGKLGQSQNRPNKKVVTEHSQLVDIQSSKYYKLSAVKLINNRAALVSYKPLEDRIKPYKYGCLVVPSQVTANSRIYLTRLAMEFEANGHVVTYADTDSILAFKSHPKATALEKLCQISERLGCLKIEKDGVKKFFCTAAKTYSLETVTGEVTIKAKGFSLLEKLLKDNLEQCLLEKSVTKMFTSIADNEKKPNASMLVFQKQIKVDPFHMVPGLVAKAKSYKVLNFIGPRRMIDIDNWLEFNFERLEHDTIIETKVKPLQPLNQKICDINAPTFNCNLKFPRDLSLFKNSNIDKKAEKKFTVGMVPKVQGILPAIPYGLNIDKVSTIIPFYNLLL